MLQAKIPRNQGGALLTALFIMTLVAIVATAMSTKLQLDIYRTRLIMNHDKLYLAAQAVSFWALGELKQKKNQFTKSDVKGMVRQFPPSMGSIYNSVKISGGLYDLQSRFNLNNLGEKKAILNFMNFASHTPAPLNEQERMNLALAINDWLSPYDLARGKDNYTSYYLSQKPPYHPSHQLMSSISELRLIKDVSAAIYLALEPYSTVLPEPTRININTASKQVILSLGNAMNESQAKELMMARGENGITDINEISELLKKLDVNTEQITLESNYFLSVAYVTSGDLNLTVYTLLKRSVDKNKKLSVSILRQSVNAF